MLNGNGTAPKVVVVGGSLGGLFNAIALRSLGCEVEVFEKSSGLMKDRGAGIVFQQEVAEFLTRYEVAPLESVVVPVRTRRYLGPDGSVMQEGPMPQAMTSWICSSENYGLHSATNSTTLASGWRDSMRQTTK
jgi:2-polyprenyl-6-methoxyphenol hydroxylase-like FAD-dependent oxidoreductase